MADQVLDIKKPEGLSHAEVTELRSQFGENSIPVHNRRNLLKLLAEIVREPMFLLLAAACALYFILGETAEGSMTVAAILIVIAISVYQGIRSNRALEALMQITQPRTRVVRDSLEQWVKVEELVPGDVIVLDEGNTVPADARLVQENDLTVNESLVTGESLPVEKRVAEGMDLLYQGTTINSGRCYAKVIHTGSNTVLGKIGHSVQTAGVARTLLQTQVDRYVKRLAWFGASAFLLIWLINYLNSGLVLQSLMTGLTLAMAAIPEEIPVAFSTFMALGAYQMSRLGIISRQPQVIENLGTVTVICLDKTGTITENRMVVQGIYVMRQHTPVPAVTKEMTCRILKYASLASEEKPFDAMEIAIREAFALSGGSAEGIRQVYEYPLEGRPPMMTHVFEGNIVAGKGALERIMKVCNLGDDVKGKVLQVMEAEAAKGYRIIGVASAVYDDGALPEKQDAFNWEFEGFICLYDPPRKDIEKVIGSFYDAGIGVKLITGDHPGTAVNIAAQAGFSRFLHCLEGEQVMQMDDQTLRKAVKSTHVFARMFPAAKERVIASLQANGEVVAMTGDGVNDVPALKRADVGIAMGAKGAAMARETAGLVITDDNLGMLTEAIRQGRKIRQNLKKSIRYIISIHIPIILIAVLPVLLRWKYPNIFTPIHIIFLELIMGPTCSVFFEKEPVEDGVMKLPGSSRFSLFTASEWMMSIGIGLVIALMVLALYFFSMNGGASMEGVRTMVFTTLLLANILLTFAARSFTAPFHITMHYRNRLAPWILLSSLLFITAIHTLPALRTIFGLVRLSQTGFLLCVITAFISVAWFEVYKYHAARQGRGIDQAGA